MNYDEMLAGLAAPARRALAGAGLTTLAKVAAKGEAGLAALHGLGPKALVRIKGALAEAGLHLGQ